MPDRILSYFDVTGESADGDVIELSWLNPMTLLHAEFAAKKLLRAFNGGHLDVWYAETGEFAFDVEL